MQNLQMEPQTIIIVIWVYSLINIIHLRNDTLK